MLESCLSSTRQSKLAYHQAKDAFVRSLIPAPAPRQKRIAAFKKALPTFSPPVFHLWFQKYYADAYSWSLAKRNFTRTAAVYSIIGYVLGLGDRHSENLLINPADGSVVHVDFNCLFMGGENFQVPECVPFRLTHNMTAAMGLTGFEGTFRYTAEDVMLLLRQYRRLFSKLVTHLLFEPLKEWTVTNKTEPAAYHVVSCRWMA